MTPKYCSKPVITKTDQLKRAGLYPFFRAIQSSQASSVTVNGQQQIMIGSNNYLGMTHHPYVQEAAIKAIERYGTGCTGSRVLNGNLEIHQELEERLARFVGHQSALLFSTGMQVNLGALSVITGPRDCMIFDSENHASILDAARLNLGATFKYRHNNMESLEQVLSDNVGRFNHCLIVADGVFSMTGDVVNLPEINRLAKKYGAMIYIDDAHGLGVLGESGKGTLNHFGLADQIDFTMGTFSKSFASIGGFVSGSEDAINYIRHSARSFIFSAAPPPTAVATVSAVLDLLMSDPSIIQSLWDNVAFMRQGFKQLGFYCYDSNTPILPIFIGDELRSMEITNYLAEQGVFATPVISPAVPKDESLIRTSYMATHKRSELERVLDVFAKVKSKFTLQSLSQ
ncbi:MAG: pyridoxal phosphate-dependent aminotransferase family protein [Bdellovibrionales bacterium]|nr:pyridoxal phosphate-dependent aminotransferase family protein [Bdellovibrionales bacterium]MBT3525288.1 pyridoxal phosphate-dependent aminotransferase family protein [Bdellovibrionales bacterium]MBT7668173.1 pyridoxal phosphate-dependent aminotransferase family protein [Bdellovibrionales bacterium]MBT7767707.1 pyridoxal phosphate-dependent aminotransferase family protein [Bdellovibrionales bacterium]